MISVVMRSKPFEQICRQFAIVAIAVLMLTSPARFVYADSTNAPNPTAELKDAIAEAVALFKDQSMPLPERREKLRDLAQRRFDFAAMSRSVLGYHWRDLNPDQRKQFIALFSGFIQDAYLSKLHDYTVQKVQQQVQTLNIQYVRETFDGPDYAQVNTTVQLQGQKDPIQVNYLMHLDGGHWRVYDVTIDAISLIANYRNQFNRVINNSGYDQLVSDLRAKQQQLHQSLDQSTSSPAPP